MRGRSGESARRPPHPRPALPSFATTRVDLRSSSSGSRFTCSFESLNLFFSKASAQACHPERSARNARAAKDLLLVVHRSDRSAHSPQSRSFARAVRSLRMTCVLAFEKKMEEICGMKRSLILLLTLPTLLAAQRPDTLLSALKLPGQAGFAPLVPAPPGHAVLLKPDRVFDAASEAAHVGWVVLVHGDSIAAVGPATSVRAPADAETIDLPGTTLLPGLIDAHSHV